MKTEMSVWANVDELQFGYWDMKTEEFVPIDAEKAESLKKAALALGCSERLLDALAMFACSIAQMVGDDLRDVWQKLES